MKSQIRKIFLVLVIMACSILFAFTQTSFALATDTHKAINEYIAQQSLNGFSFNDYLKTQLGMQG